jgi:MFS family permease
VARITIPTRFPLAERELSRSGRRKGTYWVRGLAIGAIFVIAFFVLLDTQNWDSPRAARNVAELLMYFSVYMQYFAAYAVAPLLTAGLSAQEKEERTLGLLLIAEFKGLDIFLAKFLSAFVQSELLLLSTLPLIAFSAFMGGIDVPVMTINVALLTVVIIAHCSVGLFLSTITSRPSQAFLAVILFIVFWFVGTGLIDWFLYRSANQPDYCSNVVVASIVSFDSKKSLLDFYWLPAILELLTCAIVAAILTIWLIPKQIDPKPIVARRKAAGPTSARTRRRRRSPHAALSYLALSGSAGLVSGFRAGAWRLFACFGLVVLVMFPCFGSVLAVMLVLYDVASSFAHARRSGVLDELALTPTDSGDLARAFLAGHLRRGLLYAPALVFTGIASFALIIPAGFIIVGEADELLDVLEEVANPMFPFLFFSCIVLAITKYWALITFACGVAILGRRPILQAITGTIAVTFLYFLFLFFVVAMIDEVDGVVRGDYEAAIALTLYNCVATGFFAFLGLVSYQIFREDVRATWEPPSQLESADTPARAGV